MSRVVVTGATGTVGRRVVDTLVATGVPVRRALHDTRGQVRHGTTEDVRFQYTDPGTWTAAFQGASAMLLVRPPAVANVRRDLLPAVAAAADLGVRHVVFLSLQGAARNRLVPHAAVESWLRSSGLSWTFVRPSYFTQNLTTTHSGDIRDRDELVLPAGRGRTAFVDAVDVADVAAVALADPAAHAGRAWTVTGPEALSYEDVTEVLSGLLGRRIRYRPVGVRPYLRHARRTLGMPLGMAAVTAAIYTTARLGLAAGLSGDVRRVLGRDPIPFPETARREQAAWWREDDRLTGRGQEPQR